MLSAVLGPFPGEDRRGLRILRVHVRIHMHMLPRLEGGQKKNSARVNSPRMPPLDDRRPGAYTDGSRSLGSRPGGTPTPAGPLSFPHPLLPTLTLCRVGCTSPYPAKCGPAVVPVDRERLRSAGGKRRATWTRIGDRGSITTARQSGERPEGGGMATTVISLKLTDAELALVDELCAWTGALSRSGLIRMAISAYACKAGVGGDSERKRKKERDDHPPRHGAVPVPVPPPSPARRRKR